MSAPESLPERGSLADGEFPRLLLDLYQRKFVGRLCLKRARTEKFFVFHKGAPVGSESNLPNEWLTAVLQDLGTLSAGDRGRVNEHVARKHCREGVALLALQLIEPKGLFAGLREQLRRRALECFGWVDGEYEIHASDEHSEEPQPLRMDPYCLVHEGLQGHWSLERMFGGLQPRLALYPRPAPGFPKVLKRLQLDATVGRMVANLGGNRTLAAIVGAAQNSPRAVAAFWVFDAIGALEYSETPARKESVTAGDLPLEIEIDIASEAKRCDARPEPGAEAGGKSGPAASASPNELPPEAEKMRAEVLDRLENLDSLSYYELLGVESDAPRAVIRKAYFSAAKRYHPDAINRLGLQEICGPAGEVFARIAEANDILADEAKRKDYDVRLSEDATDVDPATLAQAETFYRKGEILSRMGDFRSALELLQSAVKLYPQESVYQCDLGWAYFKKTPSEMEPALDHLREALSLDPENSVAVQRLGIVEGDR